MATVFDFPSGPHRGALVPSEVEGRGQAAELPLRCRPRACRRTEIDVAGIAILLGMANRPPRAVIERIRFLVDRHGFPAPRTPRIRKGTRLTGGDAVDAHSIWSRDQVELWFDDDTPPAAAARGAQANREQVRADLAERARRLVG